MSFVVLGNFNPAIFHPDWFGRNELIRREEAESAHIDLLATELCQFTTEWFGLQVIAEKVVLESADPTKWLPLRDLLSATFRLLEHTPIKAFGFNAHMQFALEPTEKWLWIQENFAPTTAWKQTFLANARLGSIMMEGKQSETDRCRLQVWIERSKVVPQGLFLRVNEHYDVPADQKHRGAEYLTETLSEKWTRFIEYTALVAATLVDQAD